MNRILLAGIGSSIWLAATIVFRLAGHLFFLIDNPTLIMSLWIAAFISLWIVIEIIFRWRKLQGLQFFEAAVLLALPGMIADAISVHFFTIVFPNMAIAADGPFAAWLLWAYSTVLLVGLWRGRDASLVSTG